MADGINILDGTAKVATDDAASSGHVQIVKLAHGTDGSATPIGADANGLDVDVTRLPGVGHDVTGVADGRKVVTTAGTPVALASSTPAKGVQITAETDNTGTIVVGSSTVVATLATRRGTPLGPGDSLHLRVDNLADVYLDSTVSGDGVTFTAET